MTSVKTLKTENGRHEVTRTIVERPTMMQPSEIAQAITNAAASNRELWRASVVLTYLATRNANATGEAVRVLHSFDGTEYHPGTLTEGDKDAARKALSEAWKQIDGSVSKALKSEKSTARVYLGMLSLALWHGYVFEGPDSLPTNGEISEWNKDHKSPEDAATCLNRLAGNFYKHAGSGIPVGTCAKDEATALFLACAQSLGLIALDAGFDVGDTTARDAALTRASAMFHEYAANNEAAAA